LGTDNAFAELGLASDATEHEVKAAWRRLASQWHPDRNASSDASARMQRINQAFEHIRRTGFTTRAASGPVPQPPDADAAPAPETPDAAAGSTSGARDETHGNATADTVTSRRLIRRKIKLTLEEAAAGCIKVLRGKLTDICTDCAGVGSRVLDGQCMPCGGSGTLQKRSFFGWSAGAATECETCLGSGSGRVACTGCKGTGKLPARNYGMKVRIPQGVRHGDLLHVDGRRVRAEGPNADVEIRVEVSAHPLFQLDDDGTIHCNMPVDGFAWIANRPLKMPTLSGFQTVALRRDRLSYRLEGQGFPVQRQGPRGDQIVTLTPVFPSRFSIDQQILLDQLTATGFDANGEALDERLREWNRDLRAWEKDTNR
jgi:molecular chaperone DnaJ